MGLSPFREHIRASISDASLQAALDANAQRRLRGRANAFASLPDWQARRKRAHAVRAHTVTNLDEYLGLFIKKLAGNGIGVHRAANAEETIRLVLAIAQASTNRLHEHESEISVASAKLFAKSKSIVSEEIRLNDALEAQGHRVVETDLGEFIVQLRGEKPSHILAPAVHLQRHQVGELFQEKLGLPLTDDIASLTAAARRVLREVFLTADVGISGVNFGVAETGTLCIVTNEGNGRMVTTIPPVHIALIGMERLLPTLDDLALMLSILPRSATGQKLSVYTQLIHAARRSGEVDGAAERHVIIVDNGRSRLQDSALREALYCIRCGACLNACPVFREIGGHAYVGVDGSMAPYPGPIGSIISPGLLGLRQFGHLAQASSLCGACKDVCPVEIDLPRLLTRVRAGQQIEAPGKEAVGLSTAARLGLQAYNVISASRRGFETAQGIAALAGLIISPFSEWIWLPSFTGWGHSKDLPRPAIRPFRARFRARGSRMRARAAAARVGRDETGSAQAETGMKRVESPPAMLVERFVLELQAVGAQAFRTSRAELPARLTELFRERSIDAIMTWAAIPGVDEDRLRAAGLRLIRAPDASARAGLTGAAAGIAETGTLVVHSGRDRLLSASLLPEVHVAVVEASHLVESLEDALRGPEIREASSAVLITGPSRTADIEMTLTIGVHGPKELIVYIVE